MEGGVTWHSRVVQRPGGQSPWPFGGSPRRWSAAAPRARPQADGTAGNQWSQSVPIVDYMEASQPLHIDLNEFA
eukprot:scaffold50032_cov13-Prasinocladus_malaysianus.AAC.1